MRASLVLLLSLSACGDYSLSTGEVGGGGYGAQGGGAQDIGYARDLIGQGGVPTSANIPTEGLLAEHDVPVAGPACEDLLCLRPVVGTAPSLVAGGDAVWVQLGLTSGLQAPYERPPVDVAVVIDKSSSMSIDLDQVETAVGELIGHMGPDDRLAVVAFDDDVHVVHGLSAVTDPDGLRDDVDALKAKGGWSIQQGMKKGVSLLTAEPWDGTRVRRVILMTCGYPDVSEGSAFAKLVEDAADDHVGTSVYGVILGWEPTLADLLAGEHGGAYGYLESLEKVEAVFDDDVDLELAPIAYDLDVALTVPDGWKLDRVYGIPGDDGETSAAFSVTTVFPSRQHGAMFARLVPDDGHDVVASDVPDVSARFAYDPEPAQGWDEAVDADEAASVDADTPPSGLRIGAALVNEAEVMQVACDEYWAGDADAAIARLDALADYLEDERVTNDDASLDAEVDLVRKLAENMAG